LFCNYYTIYLSYTIRVSKDAVKHPLATNSQFYKQTPKNKTL